MTRKIIFTGSAGKVGKKFIMDFYGPPCEEYDPMCVVCSAWHNYKHKKVKVYVDREKLFSLILKGEL